MYLKKYKKKNCPNGFLITAMQWAGDSGAVIKNLLDNHDFDANLSVGVGDYVGFDYKGDQFVMAKDEFEDIFEEVGSSGLGL